MSLMAKLTAPASVLGCVIMLIVYLLYFPGHAQDPPAVLDPSFRVWTDDPRTGKAPLIWEVSNVTPKGDRYALEEKIIHGRRSLQLKVYRSVNSPTSFTSVTVRQAVEGRRLQVLLNSEISLRALPMSPFFYDEARKMPSGAFGLTLNDGFHIIWVIFSNAENGKYLVWKNFLVIFVQTPLNVWSNRTIDIKNEYLWAGWPLPSRRLTLGVILAAGFNHSGYYSGYIEAISVQPRVLHAPEPGASLKDPDGVAPPSMFLWVTRRYSDIVNVLSQGLVQVKYVKLAAHRRPEATSTKQAIGQHRFLLKR